MFSFSQESAFLYLLFSSTGNVSTQRLFSVSGSASVRSNQVGDLFFSLSFCRSCSNWALTSVTQKPQVLVSPKLGQNYQQFFEKLTISQSFCFINLTIWVSYHWHTELVKAYSVTYICPQVISARDLLCTGTFETGEWSPCLLSGTSGNHVKTQVGFPSGAIH